MEWKPSCRLVLIIASVVLLGSRIAGSTEETGQTALPGDGQLSPHSLSIWRPVTSLIKTSWDVVQGRGKQKGGQGMLMMGGMMLMMALSGLAALAGKALAASMAALMLAAMSLMKKGGGGGHHSTYEVVTVPHHTSSHHRSSNYLESDASGPLPYVLPTSFGGAATVYDSSVESAQSHHAGRPLR